LVLEGEPTRKLEEQSNSEQERIPS
jgi:hypothetical protein